MYKKLAIELWSCSRRLLMAVSVVASILASVPALAQASLAAYNVKLDESSVSGISSGAYMAVQFAVAHSAVIKGVGAIAGGPYYCAQNSTNTAYRNCMVGYPAYPTVAPLVETTTNWASGGDIDPTTHIANQKVWLFSGYNDGVVKKGVTDVLYGFYTSFTAPANIFYKDNLPAAHSQVTDSWGQACSQTGGDFINNCGYDAAGQILQHIFGTLSQRNTGTLAGTIQQFDQSEFYAGSLSSISMAQYGYAYVPASCAAQQPCRVHVAFHGCKQYAGAINSDYYAHAGYNEWADTNNLIVLYPQTTSSNWMQKNPNGCWDWWGYNDGNYAKKSGAQIGVVMAMLQRLAGQYSGWSSVPTGAFGTPGGITAADSSASRIELHWNPVAGAAGYTVYRADCAGCAFSKINDKPVVGASFADAGLSPSTAYHYRVRAIDGGGQESGDSATVSLATAPVPPVCDPYYRTNYDHWLESRAYTDFFNLNIYADGSKQWMGYTGPTSYTSETFLTQTSPSYYAIGVCQ